MGQELEDEVTTAQPTETVQWYQSISYKDAKIIIRTNLTTAARCFIAVGYYLKHIRDTEGYREDGFADIWDFANAEYGISMSTASRYMSMNDRFSQNGNSPLIRKEYKEFGKSQLQEMLSLTDEQLEQVRPTDRVEDIRNMRKPHEIPYMEIPGQVELTDFPGVDPADAQAAAEAREKLAENSQDQPAYTVSAADLLGEDTSRQPIAISQQEGARPWKEEKIDESYNIGDLPQAKESLLRQLAQVLTERYGSQLVLVGVAHMAGAIKERLRYIDQQDNGITLQDGVQAYPSEEIIEFDRGEEDLGVCTYARFETQARKALDEWVRAGKSQAAPEQEQEPPEEVIDAEFEEIQESEPGSDIELVQDLLRTNQKLLNRYLNIGATEDTQAYIRQQELLVAALEAAVRTMQPEPAEPEAAEQPDLPLLKNNEQRAAFVDAYETWPLWIETVQTGERYYRYDLEDGTSMVVKVYHARLFAGFSEESYENQYHEGYGHRQYYLLQPEKFFRDCDTSRSLLIEKLKEIQKAKKGNSRETGQ